MGRIRGFYLLFVIGAAALTIRAILDSDFRNSTLLYLLVPFAVSIALHLLLPRPSDEGKPPSAWRGYLRHMRDATIVMLATSAILFEGFLCVLFFMPIYYLIVSLGFAFSALADRGGSDGVKAYAIPALLLLLTTEGLFDVTTVPRYRETTYVEVLDGTVAELQANMALPVRFERERHWFLTIFPLPTRIEAASLGAGDIHRLHFVYRRWFVANFHEGAMAIRIDEVSPRRIRTSIVENESYLSHYMRIRGTEIRFRELGGRRTEVALTVKYDRLLDPAWYFGPMQQLAARQSARYFIDTIIARRS